MVYLKKTMINIFMLQPVGQKQHDIFLNLFKNKYIYI